MSMKGIFTGTAGVYYVMYQLALRGFHASCTHGNAPNLDILVSSEDGDQSLAIQVKTTEYATRFRGRGESKKPALLDFPLGYKAGRLNKANVMFAFVDLNSSSDEREVDVYLVPSPWVTDFCKNWIDSVPMVKFQPTIEAVEPFLNNWSSIAKVVGEPPKAEMSSESEQEGSEL